MTAAFQRISTRFSLNPCLDIPYHRYQRAEIVIYLSSRRQLQHLQQLCTIQISCVFIDFQRLRRESSNVIDSQKRHSRTRRRRPGLIHYYHTSTTLLPTPRFNLQHSFASSLLSTSRRGARNSRPTDRPSPAKTTPTNLTLLVETHIDMRVRMMNVEHEIYANCFFSTPNTWRIPAPSTGPRQLSAFSLSIV